MINQVISHYKILDKIGEGGMGVVYKAKDTKLRRTVALKFLPTDELESEEDKVRLVVEAQAAAALNHPSICTIYEIDEADGQAFIAMEYVDGQTLKERMESGGMDAAEAIDIALHVAEGLQEAHSRGIVHRDIKPANIMMTSGGQSKIMDFGLAKSAARGKTTHRTTTVGTQAYMSPEQVRGQDTDHRTDIWSLGVVIYEMLAGRRPFGGDYRQALVYSILNEDPEPLTGLPAGAPTDLGDIVLEMLRKDPGRRLKSMSDFLAGLRDAKAALRGVEHREKEKAIAVLPFKDISPDKESDYFSDGLTEELLISLSKLKDIRVVSRTTTMRYKGAGKNIKAIGREIGARYIIEGSVRRFKDDLRISVQLIDVASDTQLWAETYKGRLADVFDIQEQVSRQIVDSLTLQLTPSEKIVLSKRPTLNPEAFDLCLHARDFLYQTTRTKLRTAIVLFEKAIELDPRYADAYAGLGETYATLYQNYDRRQDLLDKAIESSLKAIMYDSTLSEAYSALSLSYFHKGSLEKALEAGEKAIELDPNSFVAHWTLGRIYHTSDRDSEAAECLEKVISLNPDFYTAYMDLRMCYERLGEREEYQKTLKAALKVYPRYLLKHPEDGRAYMFYATDLAQAGKKDEAMVQAAKALEWTPNDPLMLYNAACFYARMDEKAKAMESLREAVAAGFENFEWIKRDTDLENIRGEKEYSDLVEGK
jgi:serine/threonine protein kinase/Tfp pilus assembly protein PilF